MRISEGNPTGTHSQRWSNFSPAVNVDNENPSLTLSGKMVHNERYDPLIHESAAGAAASTADVIIYLLRIFGRRKKLILCT